MTFSAKITLLWLQDFDFLFFSLFFILMILRFKKEVWTGYLSLSWSLNPNNSTLASTENSNRVCLTMQLEEVDQLERPFFRYIFHFKNVKKKQKEIKYERKMKMKPSPSANFHINKVILSYHIKKPRFYRAL